MKRSACLILIPDILMKVRGGDNRLTIGGDKKYYV